VLSDYLLHSTELELHWDYLGLPGGDPDAYPPLTDRTPACVLPRLLWVVVKSGLEAEKTHQKFDVMTHARLSPPRRAAIRDLDLISKDHWNLTNISLVQLLRDNPKIVTRSAFLERLD
jgi:hypothetical protein